jgi:putative transferase (TIGR04331 family)
MFLATTALSEFWDREQRMLFLGSWCLRYERRQEWKDLQYEVMSCPWDDREQFHASAAYLDQFCEKILPVLAAYLGELHGERRSLRFWRILLGPWLMVSSHAAFDRFVCLKQAIERGATTTKGLDPAAYTVPASSAEHLHWMLDDHGNLQLYTQLLEQMPLNLIRALPRAAAPMVKRPQASTLRRAFHRTGALLFGRFCRTALIDLYARASDRWRISLRTGFRALPFSLDVQDARSGPAWNRKRLGLGDLPAEDEFGRYFSRLLPWQLPTAFVEGFDSLRDRRRSFPANVKAIASAVGWHADDAVKFVLADAGDRGRKLIAVQHGAGYGQFRSAPAENHEKRLADRFFVWGWADQMPRRLRNVPGVALSRLSRTQSSPQRSRTVLFVGTAHPRYLYRFHSCPVGNQWDDYFAQQRKFFELTGFIHHALVYHPYPVDYGYGLRQRMTAEFPGVRYDDQTSAAAAFGDARIVVVDHCGTTTLESIAADIPTILFWDPQRWEMRPAAAEDFSALQDARILHVTPDSAAAHLRDVFDDPDRWWRDAAVRKAADRFRSRYALASRRWPAEWASALDTEWNAIDARDVSDSPN